MPNLSRNALAAPLGLPVRLCCLALSGLGVVAAPAQAAGFIDDSHGTLTLRNYYLDRDYKDGGAKTAAREWAQGAILNLESGFTPGTVGFGLDARGLLGIKLDSAPDRSGTELLPVSASDKRAADEYSRLAMTAKLRLAQTSVKTGDVSIFLPFAFASPSRLLPQTFRGTTLSSKDIDGLTLNTGYIDRINKRDSTDYQALSIASPNRRFNGAATSSHMAYLGAITRSIRTSACAPTTPKWRTSTNRTPWPCCITSSSGTGC